MNYTVHPDIKPKVDALLKEFEERLQSVIDEPVLITFHISYGIVNEGMIKDLVCEAFGMAWEKIVRFDRRQDVVAARQVYCYLCRYFTNMKMVYIGTRINRDHTTAIQAIKSAEHLLSVNDPIIAPKLRSCIQKIEEFKKQTE